ncbi:MAG: branched-chain amino acid ABC transporter permease [Burkholderiales bacterium]|nr:branched-chain amino acid ABC transporter permease [Burkholderiales bacterium]
MSERRDAVLVLGALGAGAAVPAIGSDYWTGFAITALMWIALAQSWSVFSGLSGYVSFGHVVFYGLGAYLVVATWDRLSPALSVPLAALAAAAFALAIGAPVLRVRGPYFVILSFGIAELVKFVVIAAEAAAGHASRLILRTPDLAALFYLMLALAAAATALAWAVRSTRLGHGLRAIREDEVAAETIGVPVARYKLAALALSAAVPGAVGGTMAMRATYFEPLQAFDPMVSFTMIAMAVIGGSDDLRGPVLGALVLVYLSELLWAGAPQLYMVILGALVLGFALFVPGGLCGRAGARRARPA